MNIFLYYYKIFRRIFPKEVQLYTLIFIFHICRKTIFNTANDGGSGGQLLIVLCVLLNLFIVARERRLLKPSLRNNGLYLLYYTFAIGTIFTTNLPRAVSAILPKAVEVITSFMALAVVFWKIRSGRLSMIYMLYLTTFATFFGYVSYALAYGTLWAHTNTYSLTGAIGALICLSMMRYEQEFKFKCLFVFNFGAMILGTSSASFIAFAAGYLLYLSSAKKGINIAKALLVFIGVIIVYYFGMDVFYDIFFHGRSEEYIHSASGRESIWEAVWIAWEESPWTGQGYMVGERNLILWGSRIEAQSAHNGYLSILVNTGIIGCIIYGLFLLKTIWNCWSNLLSRAIGKEMATLFIVLFCVMVNCYAYPCFGSDWNFTLVPVSSIFILINTLKYKSV